MRKIRTAVFAGIAALTAAGTAIAAAADTRVMNVDLPDGSVARIEYQGDVAPKVSMAPATKLVPIQWIGPFEASPFAMVDRIAAAMQRQSEMMMQQVHALQREPNAFGEINLASFGKLPAGTTSYSFSSTSTGSGTCSRSVKVTSLGAGQQPKVVSKTSGDCGSGAWAPVTGSSKAAETVGPSRTTI